MRLLVNFARIFVGVLFIFSGFVKLNDPLGFSYKLNDYFQKEVLNLEFLQPFALALAIFIVIYELMLGVTLLLGYAKNFTRWSLLLMIIFFTFLTFYSAYFNKVTDCGCFGDAIPLTPWQSFSKDVILLLLIALIFFKWEYITPIFKQTAKWLVFAVFIACLGFAYYVLMHLPAIDFRAYKVGVNIEEGMIQRKGEDLPSINDFGFYTMDDDFTDEILNDKKVLVVVAYNLTKSENQAWQNINEAVQEAKKHNYRVVGLSASDFKQTAKLKENYGVDIDFYINDETAIKTIIRANPGLMILHKGTIMQKKHWNDASDLDF